MTKTYTYDHRFSRHVIRHILLVLGISAVVLGLIAGAFILYSERKPTTVSGTTKLVPQAQTKVAQLQVSQPDFSFELPIDWKQTASEDNATVHSVSWQATAKNEDNRSLTVYIDTIPTTMPVNRELPVYIRGSQLSYGSLSDNCSGFTAGGTNDVAAAAQLKPAPSVWQGINFVCDLPRVIDNQVGTGSSDGVNTVTVTGPSQGTHSYFFLYTDLNVDPNYTILLNVIQSFRAK